MVFDIYQTWPVPLFGFEPGHVINIDPLAYDATLSNSALTEANASRSLDDSCSVGAQKCVWTSAYQHHGVLCKGTIK